MPGLWGLGLGACMGVVSMPGGGEVPTNQADSAEPETGDTGDGESRSTAEDTAGHADTGSPGDTATAGSDPVDYRLAGPFAVQTGATTVEGGSGCSLDVDTFAPTGQIDAPVVVLSHGFSRDRAQVSGWAEHLASWGIQVVTPGLCHGNIFDSDHLANGLDLRSVAARFGGDVVYAGHSAGGLASLLAAVEDTTSVAVVGLDLTDSEDLGKDASVLLTVPYFGLVGESSGCNSENNGVNVAQRVSRAMALRVTEADHCDFENPTDWLCTTLCAGGNGQFQDSDIQDTIRGLFTAAVMDATGSDDAVDHWWLDGGVFRSELNDLGAVSSLLP